MTNNQILRRIRYALDLNDQKMMQIFAHAEVTVTRAEVSDWLKKDDDSAFIALPDIALAAFLNGLIIERRGKKRRWTTAGWA